MNNKQGNKTMTKKKQKVVEEKKKENNPITLQFSRMDDKRLDTIQSIAKSLEELIKALNAPLSFKIRDNKFNNGLRINIMTDATIKDSDVSFNEMENGNDPTKP
jgi:hypothetical protein